MRKTASYRLSELARKIIADLSEKMGISQTAILELAIREFNKKATAEDQK
jgi:hypothetical protein